jgi:hypothetical protein
MKHVRCNSLLECGLEELSLIASLLKANVLDGTMFRSLDDPTEWVRCRSYTSARILRSDLRLTTKRGDEGGVGGGFSSIQNVNRYCHEETSD